MTRWLRSPRSLGSWWFMVGNLVALAALVVVMVVFAKPSASDPVCAYDAGASGASTTDGTSFTTAGNLSATSGTQFWVFVTVTGTAQPAPTMILSGAGVTWTDIESATYGTGGARRVQLFRGTGTGSSGALTIDSGGNTHTGFSITSYGCTGAAAAALQVVSASSGGASVTSGTLTFGSASQATSTVIGMWAHAAAEATTEPGGWVFQSSLTHASPGIGVGTATKTGSLTSGTASWATSATWAGIMVEVQTDAPPPTTTTTEAPSTTTTAPPGTTTTVAPTTTTPTDTDHLESIDYHLTLGLGLIVFLLATWVVATAGKARG